MEQLNIKPLTDVLSPQSNRHAESISLPNHLVYAKFTGFCPLKMFCRLFNFRCQNPCIAFLIYNLLKGLLLSSVDMVLHLQLPLLVVYLALNIAASTSLIVSLHVALL